MVQRGSRFLFSMNGQNASVGSTHQVVHGGVYHEKQIRELCALHALNNLFQSKDAFSKEELDVICDQLASPKTWMNPHRSPLGWGNYDVNVIMAALQRRGYELIWFDKRKTVGDIDLDSAFGFIINIPNEYHVGIFKLPINRRHWIAIKEINNIYFNLDSKLKEPIPIGRRPELIAYLNEHLSTQSTSEVFFVVPRSQDNQNSDNTVIKEQ